MNVGQLRRLIENVPDEVNVEVKNRKVMSDFGTDAIEALYVKDSTESYEHLLIEYWE